MSTAATASTIAVAIVEDDRRLREGLRLLVDGTPGFAAVAAWRSAEEALRAPVTAVDVLLLDVELPGRSGDEAVSDLLARFPGAVALMLTVFDEEDHVFAAICNGAVGYLLKRTPPARLLEAIREAREGGSPMSPEIARKVLAAFRRQAPPRRAERTALSPQERRLVERLSQGMTYEEAARDLGVTLNTVRNHVRHVYEKLHVHSRAGAVGKALRAGLI